MPRATKKAPFENAVSADFHLGQGEITQNKKDAVSKILNYISRWSVYVLIFLMPFFFLPGVIDSIYLSKQFLAAIFVLISVIALSLRTLLKGEAITFIKAKLSSLLIIFVGVVVLSAVFSGAKNLSFWGFGGSEPYTGLSVALIVAMFFLGLSLFSDKKFLERSLYLFSLSSAILFVFAILEAFLVGVFKINVLVNLFSATAWNPFGSANALSIFAAASFIFAAGVLFVKGKLGKGLKFLFGLQAISALFLIVIIGYRFSYLALAIATLFFIGFIFARFKAGGFIKKVNIPLLVFAVFLLLFVFNISFARFFTFPTEISPNISVSFNIGWESMKENIKNFVLGTGPSTFAYDFARYKPDAINQTGFWNVRFTSGFAAIPTLMAELGLLGILSFSVFIFYYVFILIKRIFKEKGEHEGFFTGLVLAFLVFVAALFIYPLNFITFFYLALVLVMAISIVGLSTGNIKVFSFDTLPHRALLGALSLIGVLIGSAFLLFISASHFIAEVNYTKGLTILATGDRETASGKFAEAINWYEDDVYYRTLALTMVDNTLAKINSGELGADKADTVRATLQNAISFAKKATEINPKEREDWFALGAVYERLLQFVNGADELALAAYAEVEKLEPANPVTYLAEGRTYFSAYQIITQSVKSAESQSGSGKVDEEALDKAKEKAAYYLQKAEEKLNLSLEKKNNLEATYILLSQLNEAKGDMDKAVENLSKARIINSGNLDSLFNLGRLLYNQKKYDLAVTSMENILKVSADHKNALFILGLAYDGLDKKDKALEIFNKLADLDPENKTVADILSNLEKGNPAVSGDISGAAFNPSASPAGEELSNEFEASELQNK